MNGMIDLRKGEQIVADKKEITDQMLKARDELLIVSSLLQHDYFDKSLEALGAAEVLTNWVERINE